MDLADGSRAHTVFMEGRRLDENSKWIWCPPELENGQSLVYEHASKATLNLFHLDHIDGVLYGTQVKRVTPICKATYGILIAWSRNDRLK